MILILGFVWQDPVTIGVGLALGSLAGLELSAREHFAGYRSHTMLLAGSAAARADRSRCSPTARPGPADLPDRRRRGVRPAFLALRAAFRRASGGLSYRIGGLRGSAGKTAGAVGRPSRLREGAAQTSAGLRSAFASSSCDEQQALAVGEGAEALVLGEREGAGGTCGPGCGPSGAGWSEARQGSCSRSPRSSPNDVGGVTSPPAIARFRAALASRTRLARARACMCWGALRRGGTGHRRGRCSVHGFLP